MSEKLNLFFVLIFFVTLTQFGYCQICTRQTTEVITKIISYSYTYKESYRTKCSWYKNNCVKTRVRLTSSLKNVPTRRTKIVEECCPGYIREDTENNTISCKPICVPACKNGLCRRPGECVCLDGYSPGATNSHECFPICEVDCTHGTCAAPNTCACDFGYSLQNDTCKPICTEPCENGRCSAPDTCECLPGYREVDNNCEPYCSKGCTNGVCIGPEECQCDHGYKEEDNLCVPTCEQECGNGTCVGPNICMCDPGYEYQFDTCEPICHTSCGSGSCIGPDMCDCYQGFELENGTCKAACTDCTNGVCVAPETCQCHPGFVSESESNVCEPACTNCEGQCIAPSKCVCEHPLIAKNLTASDLNCDCFENCTDDSKKCVKTVCLNPGSISGGSPEYPAAYDSNNIADRESLDADDNTVIAVDYNQTTQKYDAVVEEKTNSSNNSGTMINMDNAVTSTKRDAGDNWFPSIWIYVIASVLVLLFVTLIIAWLIFKKFLPRSSNAVDDDHHVACTSSRFIDLKQSV